MSVYCGDGEPLAYYRETPRVARKEHECCACEIPILPGHRYWVIAACWDGSVHGWKRCDRCQLIHVLLRPLCAKRDEWPDEALNCGHEFEEVNGYAPPAWLAAMAFWRPGDPLPATIPCISLSDLLYYVPAHEQRNVCTRDAYAMPWKHYATPAHLMPVQGCFPSVLRRDHTQPCTVAP